MHTTQTDWATFRNIIRRAQVHDPSYRSLEIRCKPHWRAICRALWLPKCPSSTREVTERTVAISWSTGVSMAGVRTSCGVSVVAAWEGFLLPFGRPGRRVECPPLGGLAAALALRAVFSTSLRTTCSTRMGNDRRFWTLTRER